MAAGDGRALMEAWQRQTQVKKERVAAEVAAKANVQKDTKQA